MPRSLAMGQAEVDVGRGALGQGKRRGPISALGRAHPGQAKVIAVTPVGQSLPMRIDVDGKGRALACASHPQAITHAALTSAWMTP
jgi:hypothetical protein